MRGGELSGPPGSRLAWRTTTTDEDQRAVAHALLNRLLAHHGPLRIARQCPACGSAAHGVPVARGEGDIQAAPLPLVSISYARGLVAVGVAPPNATAFGIDLELDSPDTRSRVIEALGDAGAEVADWTRIEAAAKARGTGLRGTGLRGTSLRGDGPWGNNSRGTEARPAVRPGADTHGPALHFAELRFDAIPGDAAAILTVALASPRVQPAETTGNSGSATA